ncbi:MAG: CaiB/BaiF CoA transferase family protein [Dehalococcoidia bacterium]
MPAALHEVFILDFTRYQQGPFATMLLSDLGARVLKVEEPEHGDLGRRWATPTEGFADYFEAYNRNKRSLTLNLRSAEAKQIVYKLVDQADVVVENFRPGVMDRLELGYERLRAVNPRLIYAAASAFGPEGPLAQRPGFDHIAQAYGGIMVEQGGGPGREPVALQGGFADQVSAMLLALAISTALYAREHEGTGQKVEVSLLGSQLIFQNRYLLNYLRTGKQPVRSTWRRSPTYTHYKTADGYVAIAAVDPKHWPLLCEAIVMPALLRDPRFEEAWERDRNAAALTEILEARFLEQSTGDWLNALIGQDVPCGPVQDYAAIAGDPQVLANHYIEEIDHPLVGPLRVPGVPIHMSGTPPIRPGPAPALGQNTEEVLLDLGYTWEAIEHLRDDRVI